MSNIDICLVQFPIFEEVVGLIPHAPALFASMVEEQGFSYKFLDWNVEYNVQKKKDKTDEKLIEKWVNDIKVINPRFLGISIFTIIYPNKMPVLTQLLEELKTIDGLKVVIGGAWVTLSNKPIEWLNEGKIDYYVKGDGEEAIIALLNGEDHESINAETLYHFRNLDSLPVPKYKSHNLLKLFYPLDEIIIESSRGCLNNCSFCPNLHNSVTIRNPETVANEIYQLYSKYKISTFIFSDSMLNMSPTHVNNLANEIIKIKNRSDVHELNWRSMWTIRSKELFNADVYTKLKESGCYRLSIGLESGSARIREEYNKGFIDIDNVYFIAEQTYNNNIMLTVNIIVGYYNETEEEYESTLEIVKNIRDITDNMYVNLNIYEKDINYVESTEHYNAPLEWTYGDNDYVFRMKLLLDGYNFCKDNDIVFIPSYSGMLINLLNNYIDRPGVKELMDEHIKLINPVIRNDYFSQTY